MATKESEASGVYPYAPIGLCLPLATAVKGLGGSKAAVSKSLLASALKEDEKSQGLTFRIASAKCYGMITGRSDFLLTETANRYFFPTQEGQREQALLEFFDSPPAFNLLIQRLDGSILPSAEMLGNILHKEARVPASWKDRVAGFFIRSAQSIGIVDSAGHLRFKAMKQGGIATTMFSEETGDMQILTKEPSEGASAAVRQPNRVESIKDIDIWTHTIDGKTIRIERPIPLSQDLWEVLDGFVKLIKPKK